MASLALGVKFIPASSGTGDFVYSSTLAGYLGPSDYPMVDGKNYRYRAENAALSEWEFGTGIYTASTKTLTRATVSFSSTGSKISFTNPPQVGIVTFVQDILQFDDTMSLTSAQGDQARANLSIVGKNKIINGGFTINQRSYVSAATLAANVYGHDRWKAGASGGDYSFTQIASPTTITIAANKSLVQVVEDKMVEGGIYTLSWSGTATARVTINSATPSGNFAVSPITVTGQTAGTTMSVEFTGANAAGGGTIASSTGTVGAAQLELGTKATSFEFRPYGIEFHLAQRYCQFLAGSSSRSFGSCYTYNSSLALAPILFSAPMRAAPTATATASAFTVYYGGVPSSGSNVVGNSVAFSFIDTTSLRFDLTVASAVFAGNSGLLQGNSASGTIKLESEL